MHGPIEVGLTMKPDGTVASAVVTKAKVETKPDAYGEAGVIAAAVSGPGVVSRAVPRGVISRHRPHAYLG